MSIPSHINARRRLLLLASLSAIAAFLVYLPALGNGFVNWDDDDYVYQNPALLQPAPRLIVWAFSRFYAANWHPLTWISHALDVAIWGLNPWGHHLTSVVLHAINTFLLVLLSAKLLSLVRVRSAGDFPGVLSDTGIEVAAVAAGLLFGLHPLHVESVTWIAERKDVLCGLFFLLGLLLYLPAPGSEGVRRPLFDKRTVLVLGCFAAALLAKPMAMTFPFVLLLLDWYPLNRFDAPGSVLRIVAGKAPFLLLSLGSAIVTVLAQRSGNAFISLASAPFTTRILVAGHAFISYLLKLIVPVRLAPLYPYPQNVHAWEPAYLLPIVLIFAMAGFCLVRWKLQKPWCAVWGYYAVTLLPVIGLVQIGFQSMADRYTYLPSIAPTLAVGLSVSWLWYRGGTLSPVARKWLRLPALAAAVVILATLSWLTVAQIGIWKDSLTLWNYELALVPDQNPVSYYHRGIAWTSAKNYSAAISDYSTAISQNPDYYEAYNNRAVLYDALDQLEPAIRDYSRSLAIQPHFKVYYNRGATYARMGMYKEAIADFTRSLALEPDNAGAYVNRAFAYGKLGDARHARMDFEKGCAMGNEVGCRMADEVKSGSRGK
jgi:tetratricopeptide (TPR) repeat protein